MQMTNGKMFESLMTLAGLTGETGKLGYAIARNRRKIMGEIKEYADVRDKLLRQYGDDKGGGVYTVPPERSADFLRELEPYTGIEHEVDVMTVSAEDMYSGGLTSAQMFALDWMVREGG